MKLTSRFTRAVNYARKAHRTQVRKGTSVPYIAHLLGVASLVLEYGGDEDQVIAGLLHDVVEDQGQHHLEIIRVKFGDRVARIVEACTDGTFEGKNATVSMEDKRADWRMRKERYLKHLSIAPKYVLVVSGADKVHNVRSILSDLANPKIGVAIFDRFTGGRDGTLWYYQSLAAIFAKRNVALAREMNALAVAIVSETKRRTHRLKTSLRSSV